MQHPRVEHKPDRKGAMAWNATTRQTCKRKTLRQESTMTDADWQGILPLLPPPPPCTRPRTASLRKIVNAIRSRLATGCQWRARPKCFPPLTTVWNYFHAWRDSGVFRRMMDALRRPPLTAGR
ncbi:MAG: transposase [Rhodobacteraceae bacterium]|nr:transposase [Paracoccaceae bacterium]